MKVLLISANTLRIPYPVYPLGLDYVAGSLDSRYQTRIVDLNDFTSSDEVGDIASGVFAGFVGVSIRNIDNTDVINCRGFLSEYQNLMHQIRINSAAMIVLGGSGFTIFPVEFMQALDADYGIAGEVKGSPCSLEAGKKMRTLNTPGIVNQRNNRYCLRTMGRRNKKTF